METKEEGTLVDYSKYTYTEESKVEMSGDLFNSLMAMLHNYVNKEIKVFYNASKELSEEDYLSQKPMIYKTEEGMVLTEMIEAMLDTHRHNVDLGNAVTAESLTKPKLELVK